MCSEDMAFRRQLNSLTFCKPSNYQMDRLPFVSRKNACASPVGSPGPVALLPGCQAHSVRTQGRGVCDMVGGEASTLQGAGEEASPPAPFVVLQLVVCLLNGV